MPPTYMTVPLSPQTQLPKPNTFTIATTIKSVIHNNTAIARVSPFSAQHNRRIPPRLGGDRTRYDNNPTTNNLDLQSPPRAINKLP